MTSVLLHEHPDLAGAGGGGIAARRAVIRWAWRLFRREWRQQVLVVTLLATAVAAATFAVAVAANATANLNAAAFGTADSALILPGSDPHLTADIATIKRLYTVGPVEVIENRAISVPGAADPVDLRSQDPHGPYGQPMLAEVSGRYPAGPGQVAVTSGVAALLNLRIGGTWQEGGTRWRVTGIVENPANLRDEFALVAPGQITGTAQVTILFDENSAAFYGGGPQHFPGGAQPMVSQPTGPANRLSPAAIVLVLAVFGLVFIGLVAVAGFTAMAQRRLRALGMLAAVGATSRHVTLVMVASGAVVGAVGTLAGAVAGLAAWLAYAPDLQASAGHVIDPFHLPWPLIAVAMAMAVTTAMAAAWRPARSAARIPVVTALAGRPAPGRASHRFAAVGVTLLAGGLGCLAFTGGWAALSFHRRPLLPARGIVATTVGMLFLAPLAAAAPAALARHAPVAVRLAVRDLGRYRSRSGAGLAAVSFVVLLAALTCLLATARFGNPLTSDGPNLAANQLLVYEPNTIGSGYGYQDVGPPPDPAGQRALQARVDALAASFHAEFALALDSAGRPDLWCTWSASPAASRCGALAADQTNQRATLWQAVSAGTVPRARALAQDDVNFRSPLYVATPALLADFGIEPGQIGADTYILTSRPGLAAVAHLELIGEGDIVTHMSPPGHEVSETRYCPATSCAASPRIQTVASLPAGTSAPGTVITEKAVHALGQQLVPDGWLIQTTGPLTAAQINAARQTAAAAGTLVETPSAVPSLSQLRDWTIAASLILALGVLAMITSLLRAETASESRVLTAEGASGSTRRNLAATTAGILGLLGAVIGTAIAYLAVIAWARGSLGTTLSPVPVVDLAAILAGLPLAAAVAGWLLGGRQPPGIARQPLE